MSRTKKKLTHVELQEHVICWSLDQIESLRESIEMISDDDSIPNTEKNFMFSAIASQFKDILELVTPLNNDEEYIVEWVKNFIDKYLLEDIEN